MAWRPFPFFVFVSAFVFVSVCFRFHFCRIPLSSLARACMYQTCVISQASPSYPERVWCMELQPLVSVECKRNYWMWHPWPQDMHLHGAFCSNLRKSIACSRLLTSNVLVKQCLSMSRDALVIQSMWLWSLSNCRRCLHHLLSNPLTNCCVVMIGWTNSSSHYYVLLLWSLWVSWLWVGASWLVQYTREVVETPSAVEHCLVVGYH